MNRRIRKIRRRRRREEKRDEWMEIANYYVVKPKNPKYTILFSFLLPIYVNLFSLTFIFAIFLQFLQQSSLYCSSTKKRERKITIRWCFIFDCNRNLLLFFLFLCFVFCFVKRERIWELWLVLFIDYFKKKLLCVFVLV